MLKLRFDRYIILGFKIFRIFRVLFENILCILCLCFYVSPVQIKYRMFCKFRVLVPPYIPYFRIFHVFRHSVPSFRQSTIPPNRVTPTRGSLVSFHLSTLNNNDLTDYKGYMGSRNKQVYFLIFNPALKGTFSYRVPPGQVRRLGQVEWSTRNTSV